MSCTSWRVHKFRNVMVRELNSTKCIYPEKAILEFLYHLPNEERTAAAPVAPVSPHN